MSPIHDLQAFADLVRTSLELEAPSNEIVPMTLVELDLDSLDLAVLVESLREQFGEFEIEATDGFIDPNWTVAELHHFVAATVDRQ